MRRRYLGPHSTTARLLALKFYRFWEEEVSKPIHKGQSRQFSIPSHFICSFLGLISLHIPGRMKTKKVNSRLDVETSGNSES
jgi:hypothetical protein